MKIMMAVYAIGVFCQGEPDLSLLVNAEFPNRFSVITAGYRCTLLPEWSAAESPSGAATCVRPAYPFLQLMETRPAPCTRPRRNQPDILDPDEYSVVLR
jgi:hypothetical protein